MPPCNVPEWCTQVRYPSVMSTEVFKDDCFSSLPRAAARQILQRHIHIHENSDRQNGSDVGSWKQGFQTKECACANGKIVRTRSMGLRHLNFNCFRFVAWQEDCAWSFELFFTEIKSSGVFMFNFLPIFLLKRELLLSQRLVTEAIGMQRQPWEYFLNENKPLDATGMIFEDDGSPNSLPSDGGLEIDHFNNYCLGT